jgi:hypothetical protein
MGLMVKTMAQVLVSSKWVPKLYLPLGKGKNVPSIMIDIA